MHKIERSRLLQNGVKPSEVFRECVSTGAAGARTRRSLRHHLLHPLIANFEASTSVRPKPGFGIGNRNQDQVSVSVSGPELFLPKPKLSPMLKSTKNSVQL